MEPDLQLYRQVLESFYDGVYLVDASLRITAWSDGAERITGYRAEQVVGRRCDELFFHTDRQGKRLCGGACPLVRTIADGQRRELELSLQNNEGELLPVHMRVAPLLTGREGFVVAIERCGAAPKARNGARQQEKMEQLALRDTLTGLANRRHLELELRRRLQSFRQGGKNFGLLFIDIDHFKQVNDTLGHGAGDRVLKCVARTVADALRGFDLLGRWSGEEFIALVDEVDEEQLRHVADRCRAHVEDAQICIGGKRLQLTISVGATLARETDMPAQLVDRADRLMYASKRAGRNLVSMERTVEGGRRRAVFQLPRTRHSLECS
ncbi:MAG TPA: sensor domain-containing diguanylate cyclase [Geobacterales bacterium]|nr:sensor domain-containing diguanylate cyclase [Geobacterales bacterium]